MKKYTDFEKTYWVDCQDHLNQAHRELDFIQMWDHRFPPDELGIELMKQNIQHLMKQIDYILKQSGRIK